MGLLRVTIEDHAEITATAARLHVTVSGVTRLAGNAALRRAAEVRDLVSALATVGLGEDAVEVTGVRLSTSTRGPARSQRVVILLTIRTDPDELPAVLGVLAEQPNLSLGELVWVFDSFEASIPLAAEAMRKARRKADAIAAAADLRVTGVHTASDSWSMPEPRVALAAADAPEAAMLRAAPPTLDLGVDFTATQRLYVHLNVDFDLA